MMTWQLHLRIHSRQDTSDSVGPFAALCSIEMRDHADHVRYSSPVLVAVRPDLDGVEKVGCLCVDRRISAVRSSADESVSW